MKFTHRIRVLGRELQVKSTTPPERVREIETFVNDKVAEVAGSIMGGDMQVVAILTMMNMAEAHLTLASKQEEANQHGNEKVCKLLRQIDECR